MWLAIFKGTMTLVWHQIRRLAGASHLPWNCDPIVVAAGGSMTREELAPTFRIPPIMGRGWKRAATFAVKSGRVLVADPYYISHSFDGRSATFPGLVIPDCVPGTWGVTLQRVRIRSHGVRVVRALFICIDSDNSSNLQLYGEVSVDLATLSFSDAERFREVASMEGKEFGFGNLYPLGNSTPLHWNAKWKRDGCTICYAFMPGLGDGVYPVYTSRDSEGISSVLVDMAQSLIPGSICCIRRDGWVKRWLRKKERPEDIA